VFWLLLPPISPPHQAHKASPRRPSTSSRPPTPPANNSPPLLPLDHNVEAEAEAYFPVHSMWVECGQPQICVNLSSGQSLGLTQTCMSVHRARPRLGRTTFLPPHTVKTCRHTHTALPCRRMPLLCRGRQQWRTLKLLRGMGG